MKPLTWQAIENGMGRDWERAREGVQLRSSDPTQPYSNGENQSELLPGHIVRLVDDTEVYRATPYPKY